MKKLTLENWQELQPYIALADYHEYNSNTMTMLMWTSMYEVHFETHPNYAIAYTCMPQREPVWLMPYCTRDHRFEAVHAIRTYSQKHGIAFEIHSMTKEFKNWLVDTYPMEFLYGTAMTQETMYMTAGSRKHCPVKKCKSAEITSTPF
ncbi:MAG: phosphatidylglycerol lysyltransferase domain-containing protein [[Clostridium] innocuum]